MQTALRMFSKLYEPTMEEFIVPDFSPQVHCTDKKGCSLVSLPLQ